MWYKNGVKWQKMGIFSIFFGFRNEDNVKITVWQAGRFCAGGWGLDGVWCLWYLAMLVLFDEIVDRFEECWELVTFFGGEF